jgi:hypothetical protein
MATLDRYERSYEPAPRNRKRRGRRNLPKPVVRIGGFLLGFIVLLLIIIFSARACARGGESKAYAEYMSEVQTIVTASDDVGNQLEALLLNPGDISRAEVQARLEEFMARCAGLEEQAKKLGAPNEIVSRGVHQMFVLVMTFRTTGTESLKTYLLGALEVEDATATTGPAAQPATATTLIPSTISTLGSVEQIMYSLRYLTTSDFLYKEVFEARAAQILAEKGIGGVTAPTSQFMDNPEIASSTQVQGILTAMRTTGNLQAVHGVALTAVMALPDSKTITQGGTFDLTASEGLTFAVTLENQGNMDEADIPITITLVSATTPQQQMTVRVSSLKAKASTTINVEGLNATTYGEAADLTVGVGPVAEERYLANNTLTAKLVFKL